MKTGTEKILIKVLFIVLLSAALFFAWQWMQSSEQRQAQNQPQVIDDDSRQVEPYAPDSLAVVHTYENGLHEVSGALSLPTPCHEIESSVAVAESFPEQVTVDLSVMPPAEDVFCIQVITEKEFNVTFAASENASLQAKVNGQKVSLVEKESGDPKSIERE